MGKLGEAGQGPIPQSDEASGGQNRRPLKQLQSVETKLPVAPEVHLEDDGQKNSDRIKVFGRTEFQAGIETYPVDEKLCKDIRNLKVWIAGVLLFIGFAL